jgi:hypothetical protein
MSTRPALAVHILHYEQTDPDAAIENDAALAYDDFLGHVKHLVDQHRECAECKHPIRPLDSVYVTKSSCQSFMDKAWQLTHNIIVDTAAPVASRMGNQAGKVQCRLWNSARGNDIGALLLLLFKRFSAVSQTRFFRNLFSGIIKFKKKV